MTEREIIIFSAAIGGAIGTAISAVSTLWAQYLERTHRQKELVFNKAVDLAIERVRVLMKASERSGESVGLPDPAITCEKYYCWLNYLFENKRLPKEAMQKTTKY